MKALRRFLVRLVTLIARHGDEARLRHEIEDHLAFQTAANIDAGMSADEARRQAILKFGAVEAVKENYRDQRSLPAFEQLFQDTRYALRRLRRNPGFTAVAVVTLALGIGANTALFSVLDALLLRTLPVHDAHELVVLRVDGAGSQAFTYPTWERLQDHQAAFSGLSAYSHSRLHSEDELVEAMWASGELFNTLGVSPMMGRALMAADDQIGGGTSGAVAVISYRFWHRRFQAIPDVVGRTVTVEGVPFTIVGVMPSTFLGPTVGRSFDVAIPLGTEPLIRGKGSNLNRRNFSWLTVIGRLRSGVTREAATGSLRTVQADVRQQSMPADPGADQWFLKRPFVLYDASAGISPLRNQYRQPLFVLLVASAVVLLIACANIANLLLARAAATRREASVRLALGATRWQLGRTWLLESLMLSFSGAAVGVILAVWADRLLLRAISTPNAQVVMALGPDRRMLMFASVVAIVTAVLFGVAPMLRLSRLAPIESLRVSGQGTDRGGRLSGGLVVAQVALSLMLVIAAGLFLKTFRTLAGAHLGFEARNVLVVNINPAPARIEPAARLAVFEQVVREVRLVPGVVSAAFSTITPISGMSLNNTVEVIGATPLPMSDRTTMTNYVSSGWFSTYSMPVITGRDFTELDGAGSPLVVIVNEAFSRKFLNGANPVGLMVRDVYVGNAGTGVPREIIGMVADARYDSLRTPPAPTVYRAISQLDPLEMPLPSVGFSVQTRDASPATVAALVGGAIRNVNPNLGVTYRPLQDQIAGSINRERLLAMLSGFFGALALLLGSLGLYGVTAYAVNRRRAELGIRIALGANRRNILMFVLRQVARMLVIGVVLGVGMSWWATRYIAPSLLFGLEPRDPVTMTGAVIVLSVVSLLAGWIPARRAARVDPLVALRYE